MFAIKASEPWKVAGAGERLRGSAITAIVCRDKKKKSCETVLQGGKMSDLHIIESIS